MAQVVKDNDSPHSNRTRLFAIAANAVFLFYCIVTQSVPLMAIFAILLPLNGWRVYQTLRLRMAAKVA